MTPESSICPECGFWGVTVKHQLVLETAEDDIYPPEPRERTSLECPECGWHTSYKADRPMKIS